MGSIIWDYFERMRPSDYGWWSLKKKHFVIYLAWPFYLVYFYFDFKKKLNNPERFWVFYGVHFSEIGLNKSKIKKFRNFEEATVFARNMAKEYQSIASIQDQSLFKWRQRQPWEGNGGEWDILRFIVEPSGEIKKSY